jgi:hypothetical protein
MEKLSFSRNEPVITAARIGKGETMKHLKRIGLVFILALAFGGAIRAQEQKKLIAGIPTDSSEKPPVLRPAPWEDGEILHYKATGGAFTDLLVITESFEEKDWRSRYITIHRNLVTTDAVDWVDSKYVPIKTKFKYQAGQEEYDLKFAPDRIEIQKNGLDSGNLPRTQPVYGVMPPLILRCLPLMKGFEIDLPHLVRISKATPTELQVANAFVKVVGRKRIAVPAGTFDCFIIETTKTADQFPTVNFNKVRYWISTQSPFYIVQHEILNQDQTSVFLKLNSIAKINKNQADIIGNSRLDLSIAAPPGWFVLADTLHSNSLILIGPECKSGGELQIDRQTGINDRETLALTVDQLIEELERRPRYPSGGMGQPAAIGMQNYRVRKDSKASLEIPGAAATRFISDFEIFMRPAKSVPLQIYPNIQYAYIYYFPAAKRIYRLSLWTRPDNFETMKPVFDTIANSVRIQ